MRHQTPQQISDNVKAMVKQAGANPAFFSGISTRKGGISTAIEAGVAEEILFLQSGHGLTKAARRYMDFSDPTRLFDTFNSF